jgi:pilus assembly protein CpaF
MIHLGRITGGKRVLKEISEIVGVENDEITLNTLYRYMQGDGLVATGNKLINTEKLEMKGYYEH